MFCGKGLCLTLITRGQLALFTRLVIINIGQTKQQVNNAKDAPIAPKTKEVQIDMTE